MRALAIILLFFNGISAMFGGYALSTDPSGNSLSMPIELLRHSPFQNFFIPGIILFTIIGLGSTIVAVLVIRNNIYTRWLVIITGSSLVIWITVQVSLIRDFGVLHAVYFLTGIILVIIAVGYPARIKGKNIN